MRRRAPRPPRPRATTRCASALRRRRLPAGSGAAARATPARRVPGGCRASRGRCRAYRARPFPHGPTGSLLGRVEAGATVLLTRKPARLRAHGACRWTRSDQGPLCLPAMRKSPLSIAAVLPGRRVRRCRGRADGSVGASAAPEHRRDHDRRPDRRVAACHEERQAAPVAQGTSFDNSLLFLAPLPFARHIPHRPVRAQPRGALEQGALRRLLRATTATHCRCGSSAQATRRSSSASTSTATATRTSGRSRPAGRSGTALSTTPRTSSTATR